ncbi:MAG: OmpA family protein [Flavobacteriales bacterium]|nr:OmpA family protein [Flavobacteriales bacterium]
MKKLLALALILGSSGISIAQDFLGFSNSNYAGVSGLDLQPASVIDNRLKTDVSLFGFNVSAYNNYIGLKPGALLNNGTLFKPDMVNFNDTAFQQNYLNERYTDIPKAVYFSTQIQLPSFMFQLNRKSALAFTWRVRTMMNIDGVSKELARLSYNGLDYPSLWNLLHSSNNLSLQAMSWAEYGVTYGRVVIDNGEHFLKVAGRVKLLQGLGAAYMYMDNVTFQALNSDTIQITSNGRVGYGHSTNFEFEQEKVKYKWVSNFSVGLDLGAVYEWRPNHAEYKYDMDGETNLGRRDLNKYKLRAGLSIIDLGGIKYKKGTLSNDFQTNSNLWNVSAMKFDSLPPVQSFDDTLINRFGQLSDGKETFTMNLPTAISAQIDYNIWKDFYINHTTYFAFQFKKNENKVHDITTFSITPRYDHRWFGVFVPVSYNMMGNFAIGTGLRLGPLTFGTTNLAPIMQYIKGDGNGKKDTYGADFHVVMKIPIPYGKPKDKDGDKVSDKKDKCEGEKGVWEFAGCADRDGDHIQDSKDACPDEPGLPEFNGCPDRDGDKIIDSKDNCPDDAGTLEFNGCPDKDGDKIIDKEDECPEVPGVLAFKGCPDTDGDGIPDPKDDCPTTPGLTEFNGCPDTDGDGVRDIDDKCVAIPGPIRNFGCPEKKLQMLNSANAMLEEVNVEDGKFNFTKDIDKKTYKFRLLGTAVDTITEVYITGPNLRGKVANKKGQYFMFPQEAAPVELTAEEAAVVKKAFDNLEFATGKDIIKAESLPSLEELAALMKKYPGWKLKIEGHTDNVGNREKNLNLSKKRAEAVKKYLVSKGVQATRFDVKYFGPDRPIAPNDTEEGRQKNRRVEMTIVE